MTETIVIPMWLLGLALSGATVFGGIVALVALNSGVNGVLRNRR